MITALEKALTCDPYDLATLVNLGKLYINEGRHDEATPLLELAVDLDPTVFLAQNYLADAYCLAFEPIKAIPHYERALQLRPDDVDVITNLSVCHWQIGEFDTAYRYAKRVRRQQPVNYGLLSLLMGDYAEGWTNWEYINTALVIDGLPCWCGDAGRHLLVLDEEQGFGDAIMMARFLPILAERCRVTFQTRPALLKLMQVSFPQIEVILDIGEVARFDAQVRLFSLPRRFAVTAETISARPYLTVDRKAVERWRSRLARYPGVKVGLCWSGSATYPMDQIRSLHDVSVLEPLRDLGATYVSLVKEARQMPNIPMLDFREDMVDFAATAALLMALDLVIAVDTSMVNLAGALGVPAWLLTVQGPDWRWGRSGERSPWYGSVRIFRQATIGDWTAVIDSVAEELSRWLSRAG